MGHISNQMLDAMQAKYIIIPNKQDGFDQYNKNEAYEGAKRSKAKNYYLGSDGYVLAETDGVNLTVTKYKTR